MTTSSWALQHSLETGHSTRESLKDPGSCLDCSEKSPAYALIRFTPATDDILKIIPPSQIES